MALQRPKTILTPFAHLQELRFDVPQEPLPGIDNKGRASYALGWTEINAIPIEPDGSGGIAPFGQDFNGILHDITSHIVYQSRGNFYTFDPEIVAAGGYNRGEVLVPDDRTWPMVLRSTIDGNTSNFNENPAYIGQTWSVLGVMSGFNAGYNYPIAGLLVFHGLLIFYNKVPTGPAFGNATTPGTDESIWETYVPGANGSYTNEPNTLCLRDATGKTMVTDPVADQDAVPKLYMEKYVDEKLGGSTDLARPVILSPEDGHVFGSLSIQVNVTELELLAGGTPIPSRTQIRVLSEDLDIIYTNRVMAYTTAPMAYLPNDFPTDTNFKVIVRHEHDFTVWSPWSDPTDSGDPTYTVDPIYPLRVNVEYPEDGADDVELNGLVVQLAPGAWSSGATFTGEFTRFAIHGASDDNILWQTGTESDPWIPYTTSYTVPNGILQPHTDYWIEAQHQADGPPPGNNDADVRTPVYDRTFPESSYFRTVAASAPDISDLQHDIPPEVLQGTFSDVKIWGATSTDGGLVTYKLTNITGGLSFSKTTGIFDNDILAMAAPTISGNVVNCTLNIIAVSSFGAESVPVPVQVDVFAGLTQGLSVARKWLGASTNGKHTLFAGGAQNSITTYSVVDAYDPQYTRAIVQDISSAYGRTQAKSNSSYIIVVDALIGNTTVSGYAPSASAYDINLTRTTPPRATSVPIKEFCMASVGEYVVFAGGYEGAYVSANSVRSSGYGYDENLTVHTFPSLSTGAAYMAGSGGATRAIMGGGITSPAVSSSAVTGYDQNKSRTIAPNLSAGSAYCLGASNDAHLYICGGVSNIVNATPVYATTNTYDYNLTKATSANLSSAVWDGSGAEGVAYAALSGGRNSGGFPTNTCNVYDRSLLKLIVPDLKNPVSEDAIAYHNGGVIQGGGAANQSLNVLNTTVNAYDKDLNHYWAN